MWDYRIGVKDHFLNPRNVGEIENPDGLGRWGPLRAEMLPDDFKLDDKNAFRDAKFKTLAAPAVHPPPPLALTESSRA